MARILPAASLKGEYGNYSVTVRARDGGDPPNVREATFHICVQVRGVLSKWILLFSSSNVPIFPQDFNDNAPEFIFPSSNQTIRVSENATLGTGVITIRAVDTDIGSNGRVRYSIRRDPLDNYKTFAIDPESGLITLQRPLDRERQKIYELRVEATDEGQTCNRCLTNVVQTIV